MKRYIAALILIAALSGCKRAPDGEVAAVVNGYEITRTELNAAMPQLPAGANAKQVSSAVLAQLINMRLMVQSAKADGLDKSQYYILKSRAADDLLLASMFAKETADQAGKLRDDKVDEYIAANPSRFSQRVVLTVDQLKVPRQAVTDAWLKDAKSLDDIAQILSAHKVAFARGRATIDSFNLEPADYAKIAAVPIGRPFAVLENGTLVLTSTISTQAAPANGDDAHRAATVLLQQKAAQEGILKRVRALHSAAKIDYEPGFEPPAPAKQPSKI